MTEEDLKQWGITKHEYDRILEKVSIKFKCSIEDVKRCIYISATVFSVIEGVSDFKVKQN